MAGSPERPTSPRPSATAADADMKTSPSAASKQPPSPSRSDRSTESEGRPVREKLQETRIDGQSSSDPPPSSDQPMKDAPNGTRAVNPGSAGQSTSGSDSERGRLRRKRSREDFEDEHEAEKHPEKKQERHTRKKSRDITSPPGSDVESLAKSSKTPVSRIDEQEGDENTKNREPTPEASASTKGAKSGISPKNKRTLEQTVDDSNDAPAIASEEGRGAKRQRDQGDTQDEQKGSKSKIPPSSGFGNNSAASPFAIASPKPQSSKISDNITDTAQTSEEKFKSSGFSTFSSASASPFSLGNSSAPSPFAPPTGGGKLSSFASSAKPSTPSGSGFGGLGSSTPTAFGGASLGPASGKSVFGATLGGSAFSTLGGTKSSLASFATPGAKGITGLSQKADKFGASGQGESESEDGSGDEGDTKEDSEKAKDSTDQESRSQNVLPGPVETGEEGEETVWSGRAKLYTLAGESGNKQWQERGMGPFKVNVTAEAPAKARFVLRADGTHRLLLNAAITKAMLFGDADGKEPTDGRLLFTAPTTDGQIESHLLRMKQDKARELYKEVISVQKNTL